MKYVKRYVPVRVSFDEEGNMRPEAIQWTEETEYKIDRLIGIRTAFSQRVGGQGDRYTVEIGGKEAYLYFEKSEHIYSHNPGRWFVEEIRRN